MKTFFLSLLLCCSFSVYSNGNVVYDKLATVNKCWLEKNSDRFRFPSDLDLTEKQWIQYHLTLVEQTLRGEDCAHLSQTQTNNRLNALQHLKEYIGAGNFPQNEKYAKRLPIFIDDHNNFCAVGYLIKATGFEHITRKIAAKNNLAYVRDMHYPELLTWANEYGFSVDELAWIQPGYASSGWSRVNNMGKGTDGNVNELFVDTVTQRLYVGGLFNNVDSVIPASNIAYVTEANGVYTWHNLGQGINGNVHAITRHDNKIFVGGNFSQAGTTIVSNIAYWDGASWNSAGCINGLVKDLVVFDDTLYACGQFSICNTSGNVNFAQWDGAGWIGIPGVSGKVNTMESTDTILYLGGAFSYSSDTVNTIKWDNIKGFQPFANKIKSEVNDFTLCKDTLYAVCKWIDWSKPVLTTLCGNIWDSVQKGSSFYNASYYAICATGDSLIVGGSFSSWSWGIRNNFSYKSNALMDYFTVDSAVNCLALFKGVVVAAGDFNSCTYDSIFTGNNTGYVVNSIGYREYINEWSIKPVIIVNERCQAQNSSSATVNIQHPYTYSGGPYYSIRWLWSTGDSVHKSIDSLSPGIYSVVVWDNFNNKDSASVIISEISIDTALFQSGSTLYTTTDTATYQWLDCSNNYTPIVDETGKSFTPGRSGIYALSITKGSCTDTTFCYSVIGTKVQQVDSWGALIFPNPATDELNIQFAEAVGETKFTLFDLAGRQIILKEVNNTDNVKINTRSLAKGIYTLQIRNLKGDTSYHKIIK